MTSDNEHPRSPIRDVAFGVAFAAGLIWLTFFATVGAVQIATLLVAVVALIWFGSVSPRRLVDDRGRPSLAVFGLASLGAAVVITAVTIISSGTIFFIITITLAAISTGLVRAVRWGMRTDREDDDGLR